MSLRGTYYATVEVYQATITAINGSMNTSWQKLTEMIDPLHKIAGEMRCRIDFGYMRPGKDAPSPLVAGRAPDRVGVMIFDPTPHVKAGQRIKLINTPISGVFELKSNPDPAVGYGSIHHLEVQVVEVSQSAAEGG